MNSKERVKSAVHFNNPDKIPVFHGIKGDIAPLLLSPAKSWNPGWTQKEEGLFPYRVSPISWKRPEWAEQNPNFEGTKWKRFLHDEVDEWGRIWNFKGGDIDRGHPGRPSIANYNEIDKYLNSYNLDPSDKSRYEASLDLNKRYDENLYHLVEFKDHGPCQLTSGLLGFSNFLIYHRKYPDELKKLLYRVTDFHVRSIEYCFKYELNPDGFLLVDDLGEQNGPYFSPQTFEKLYKDAYKPIFDKAHEYGTEVHMHSCGKIDKLLPYLIEWGLDAVEFDSPRMSGYTELAPFRGKIFFWACVNIQSLYVHSTPEEIEREVWWMMRCLGTKNGGYGAYFYPTPRVLKAPKKNIRAFQRGIDKYGDYSRIPDSWWEYPIPEEWDYNSVPELPSIN